ncbi:Hypothetical protein PP7435_CHR1-0843 [Komagataella phaffii CBS 7435]|uniref:Uncharacterized protein n=2 Tax=Komagataella phaffii TaxID=460519 RepID=C4QXC9_KOMPG|nr:Hypothetical protein PAS_chr1-4_0073 [Komagataella phaffii GS115]AOA61217.1 GQ67_02114T0 [Komagataella phaffii]CAH2446715.1 Hypothetical protein BQ9382_C1-4450 [Komagataella phaffii CBS 7435]AOA65484.1 GQ68_02129T0 [Komagataella phaffii GS115]CAY67902.1 Hypothetical protein PAS_chr1-4_0073 [Komagataella phaffii GS115]CCA36981.1 Hypothetical protein PP7435_CHR1-0843 [Komagataella phaffii CBS 7435]
MSPPHIEGFYFDEHRKKYFKITKNTDGISDITPYSISSIRKNERLKRTLEIEVPIISKRKSDSKGSKKKEAEFSLATSFFCSKISQLSPWMNTSFSALYSKSCNTRTSFDNELGLQQVINLFGKHCYEFAGNNRIIGILPIPGNSKILVNIAPGRWGSLQFGSKPLPSYADYLLSQTVSTKLLWYRAFDLNIVFKLEIGNATKVVIIAEGKKVLESIEVHRDDKVTCDFDGSLAIGNGRTVRIQTLSPADALSNENPFSRIKTSSDVMALEMAVIGTSRLLIVGLRDGHIQFWVFKSGSWLSAGKTFFGSTVTQIASFTHTEKHGKDVYVLVSGLQGRLRLFKTCHTKKGTIHLKKVVEYLNYNNDFTLGDCFHLAPCSNLQYGFFAISDPIEECIKIYRFLDSLPIVTQQSSPHYLKIPFGSSSINDFSWISLREACSFSDNGLILNRTSTSNKISPCTINCDDFSLLESRRLLSEQEPKGYSFCGEPFVERFALFVNGSGDHLPYRVSVWF